MEQTLEDDKPKMCKPRPPPEKMKIYTIECSEQNLEKIMNSFEKYSRFRIYQKKKIAAIKETRKSHLPKPVSINIIGHKTLSLQECEKRKLWLNPELQIEDNTIYSFERGEDEVYRPIEFKP